MAKQNVKERIHTHEGGTAKQISIYDQLRRSVMSCLLWEDGFYESGQTIVDRIKDLVHKNQPKAVAMLAIEARTEFKLRHVPLLLVRELARHKQLPEGLVTATLVAVIQRADELAEFLALYWTDGKQPLSAQVKKGLAQAFTKFDAYQLAKYNRDGKVKLRDVLFLCHAKPLNEEQEAIWKQLVDGTLPPPDTWEVALSGGADKKATFLRLIGENRLGYMALLRNLRNMKETGIAKSIVGKELVSKAQKSKALPFRFISAMKAVPDWEDVIETAMLEAVKGTEPLKGKTVIVVDCSASMGGGRLSGKSQMTYFDAASALAILIREISDEVAIYAYGTSEEKVPPRRGMALRDVLKQAKVGWSTELGRAVRTVNKAEEYDRLIIVTDEQTRGSVPDPKGCGYVINVASNENGVGYGKWVHIDGFSESTIRFIQEVEKGDLPALEQ